MRTAEDLAAIEVLSFVAQISDQVAEFCRSLRSRGRPGIDTPKVLSDVECRRYKNGLILSIWVEMLVDADRDLTWWMDVSPHRWKDSWSADSLPVDAEGWWIDASVSWNGRDRETELPRQQVADFRAVREAVPHLLNELFAAGLDVHDRALQTTAPLG
ncbi:MAG: hypothetical protein ACRDI2_10240 [Chloroflexota bacterium]